MCKVNPPQGTPVLPPGTYDVFYKNCNTFSDAALYFLTGTRMPACYNRIERFVTATKPVSVGLLNVIFKAMVEHNSGVWQWRETFTLPIRCQLISPWIALSNNSKDIASVPVLYANDGPWC